MVYSHWLGPEPGQGPGPDRFYAECFTVHRDHGPENHILCICIGKSK